ncbi:hypothetical protein ABZP36_023400 [Zizania latifolia]
MGNCFGSEDGEVEPVKVMARPSPPQAAMARPVMVAMAQPNARAAMSPRRPAAGKLPIQATTTSSGSGRSAAASRGRGTNAGSDGSVEGRILEKPNLRVFTFAELKAATRNFKADTVVGEGGFGRVYKGWVDERTMIPSRSGAGMAVAVKKLDPESLQGVQEWQSEVNFLGRLVHPNLVRLLGYCLEDKELLLVYEYMAQGSLENHLFGSEPRKGGNASPQQPLSWSLRLRISIGAARGLAFLHSSEKHVIYRDFKASNILLDTVLLVAAAAAATILLLLRPHNLVDWAKPYLADRRKLARLIDPRLEGQYSSRGAQRAAQLTLRCLATDHTNRPSMREVVAVLEEIESMPRGSAATGRTEGSASPRPAPRGNAHGYGQSPRPGSGSGSDWAGPASGYPSPRVR